MLAVKSVVQSPTCTVFSSRRVTLFGVCVTVDHGVMALSFVLWCLSAAPAMSLSLLQAACTTAFQSWKGNTKHRDASAVCLCVLHTHWKFAGAGQPCDQMHR